MQSQARITHVGESNYNQIIQELRNYESFYEAFKNANVVSSRAYGDMLEIAIAMAALDLKQIENSAIEDIVKYVKDAVKGGETVTRGGSDIKISFSDEIKNTYGISETLKRSQQIKIDDDLSLTYEPTINTGIDKNAKQGKIDVLINLPEAGDFRISAKNWQDTHSDEYSNYDLGNTSILAALSRSLQKDSIINDYSITLQHPLERRTPGDNALAAAHNLAKLALITDIVMGMSQKQNYANTLVILERAQKDVFVFDIVDEINKIIKNIDMTKFVPNDQREAFYIDGYNAERYNVDAIKIRKNVFDQNDRTGTRTRVYRDFMKLYLNKQRIAVKVQELKRSI